ncbi:hypothetical protein, partial [Agathobacter ruminis]
RAEKPRVRMHPSPAKAYERAQKPRVRMHASVAKAYERAKNLGFVCMPARQKHTNEPKNIRKIVKGLPGLWTEDVSQYML